MVESASRTAGRRSGLDDPIFVWRKGGIVVEVLEVGTDSGETCVT